MKYLDRLERFVGCWGFFDVLVVVLVFWIEVEFWGRNYLFFVWRNCGMKWSELVIF